MVSLICAFDSVRLVCTKPGEMLVAVAFLCKPFRDESLFDGGACGRRSETHWSCGGRLILRGFEGGVRSCEPTAGKLANAAIRGGLLGG